MNNQILKVENISAGYGSAIVVNSLSFSINQGEILSITGRNGVGKTTLLKSIMGVIPIKSGNLIFENQDISKTNSSERSMLGISYVPQGREIFSSLSVEENILLPIIVRNKFNYKDKLKEKKICKVCQGIYSYYNRTHHCKTKRHILISSMIKELDNAINKIDVRRI